MESVFSVAKKMNDIKISRRKEPLIAIGGGVLMDIVGMVASIYRRGIPYIKIPTTLMGLIDAGIGIKTGVNFQNHKNKLGSYYAASHVYLDKEFLKTIDDRHMANGISEIIKIALVKDRQLFELLESDKNKIISSRLQENDAIIHRAVLGMIDELEPNLWEENLERLVDYGHTFSPIIEMRALPELLHGEAVAIDMAISMVISWKRGFITRETMLRVINLIRSFNLPVYNPVCTAELLYEALEDTTRHRDGLQRTPLTTSIGQADFFNDLTKDEINIAVEELKSVDSHC